jgi:alkylhydroperoxidase family enzyme
MPHVAPLELSEADPVAQELLGKHGVTNMKRTLAHSPPALDAYMRWYDLHAEVVGFVGARAAMLFAHAISAQTDCLICSTFFRRWLTEAGDDPDAPALNDREKALVEYGRHLARDANGVPDELVARLRGFLDEPQLVALTAFGGLMIATNIFNNAMKVDLDEYLFPFRKGSGK